MFVGVSRGLVFYVCDSVLGVDAVVSDALYFWVVLLVEFVCVLILQFCVLRGFRLFSVVGLVILAGGFCLSITFACCWLFVIVCG